MSKKIIFFVFLALVIFVGVQIFSFFYESGNSSYLRGYPTIPQNNMRSCETHFWLTYVKPLPSDEDIEKDVREQMIALGNHIDMYNRDIIIENNNRVLVIEIDGIFEKETSDHDLLVSAFQKFEYIDVFDSGETYCKEGTM